MFCYRMVVIVMVNGYSLACFGLLHCTIMILIISKQLICHINAKSEYDI